MPSHPPRLAPTLILLATLASTRGADLTWTNGAGDTLWGSTGNWSPAQAPVAADNLLFGPAGADTSGANAVTSTLNLAAPSPYAVNNLVFALAATNTTHHLSAGGNALLVNGELRVGRDAAQTRATLSNGAFQLGTSPSARAGNAGIGVRAGGLPTSTAMDGRLTLASGAAFSAYTGFFDIGLRAADATTNLVGTADFSAGNSVLIDATRITLGHNTNAGAGQGQAAGVLRLPTLDGSSASLQAPFVWISQSDTAANNAATNTSALHLGHETAIATDELAVGRSKGRGALQFTAGVANPTLTLVPRAAAGVNLRVGYNALDTGTISEGTVDLQGGTLNATLAQLALGVHNSGIGGGRGTFLMDAGTLTADSVVLARPDNAGISTVDANTTALLRLNGGVIAVSGAVTDGNGASTVQVDAGTFNVGDAFKADVLRVGRNAVTGRNLTATLDVNGPVVAGAANQILDIGRSETPSATPIETVVGTANFADAPSVSLLASDLRLGSVSADGNTSARGVLRLSAAGSNTVAATTIQVGQSGFSGNTTGASEIHFGGATNVVRVDTFHAGRQKSNGLVDILPGGTLVLRGLAGAEASLLVANNDVATGTSTFGTFDLSAGTLNATLNQLVVGRHHSTGGNARGLFRMGAGTVTTRGLMVADPGSGGTSTAPAATMGTVVLSGGALTVNGDTLDGGGVSRLEVTSGLFAGRGSFNLDTVSVGAASGAPATLEVSGIGAAVDLRAQTLAVEPTGLLRLLQVDFPFLTTNATFAAGSRLDGPVFAVVPSAALDTTSASTWTAATNTWDDVTHSFWDRGLPSGSVVTTGQSRVVLRALGTLTDNGLAAGSADWSLQVTPGAGGQVTATRAGPNFQSGRLAAEIAAANADVTRAGDLVIGDSPSSLAQASALVMRGGILRVGGAVVDDGGTSLVNVDGGLLTVTNGFAVDRFRAGYNGLAGTLRSGGAARLGTGVETIDIGRRDLNDVSTTGTADFSTAASAEIRALDARLGSNTSGANTTVRGFLLLPVTNTAVNTVVANSLTLGDSTASANMVNSEVHLGGGGTTLSLDTLAIGRRKSWGLVDARPGAIITLGGRAVPECDLLIGVNDIDTATESRGTLDLTGATLTATLDQVVLGRHATGAGSGKGTWVLDGGVVTANSLLLADSSSAGASTAPAATTGNLLLRAGSLAVAGDIADGGGTSLVRVEGGALSAARLIDLNTLSLRSGTLRAAAITNATGALAFEFSGGLLAAGSISPGATNLVQTGGVLDPRPAGGATVVHSGYRLSAGAWEAAVGGFTNTLVDVRGALELGAGSTLNLTLAGDAFTNAFTLAKYASLTGVFAVTNNLPAGWTVDYNHQGQSRVALVQIPSPVPALTVSVENGVVVVRWTTDDETGVTGFHVERLTATPAWQRLTASPIPALGAPGGHSYAYTDTTAVPGRVLNYRVVVLKTGDVELPKGPFAGLAAQTLVVAAPGAVALSNATLSWASNEGSVYTLLRSPSLVAPVWTPVATGLAATPPVNTFTDTTAAGERFYYRVEVE